MPYPTGPHETMKIKSILVVGALLSPIVAESQAASRFELTIPNINVTSGQLTFGFYSVAGANQFIYFDDVELFRQ